MHRALKIGVLVTVLTSAVNVASEGAASAQEAVLRLQPLIQEALAVNPEIRADEKKWDAAKERPPQEGSLDDPMLSFEIVNLPTNSFSFAQDDMTMKQFSISQTFPYFGKRGLRSEVAQREANAILNRPPQTPLGQTEEVRKDELQLDLKELQAMALENRPLLKALQEEVERSKAANALARRKYFPDLTMSVAYGFREDSRIVNRSDMFSAGFSINIPLYFRTKQDRQGAETSAMIDSVREQYQAARNEVLSLVKELVSDLEKGSKLIDLLQTGLIPQAGLSLDSAVSGYQVNKVDFLTLLDNRLTLFNFEKEE